MKLASLIYKCLGWSVEINIPDCPKCIICIAPHTSNWDFIYGKLACNSIGWTASFLIKDSWFFFPFNIFFRYLGGIPVSRKKKGSDLTETIINKFNTLPNLKLAITPEGTRKKVKKWRTGIIYIAIGAKVPILLAKFDYKKKLISINDIFYPSGNVENDMIFIKNYFKDVRAKYPDKFCTE